MARSDLVNAGTFFVFTVTMHSITLWPNLLLGRGEKKVFTIYAY